MFSVVTVSHGHNEIVCDLITSLVKFGNAEDFEFILIDNLNSSFFNEERLKSLGLIHFKLVKNVIPFSFSINNNVAVSLSSNEHIAILNPDIKLIDCSLFEFFKKRLLPKGLFYPQLLNSDLTFQIHGKAKPNLFNQVKTTIFSLFNVRSESPEGSYWYFGAAILINKSFFYEIGGFDIRFPMYAEDTELCDRVRKRGFQIERLDGCQLVHGLGGDSKGKYLFKAVISNFYLRYKMFKNGRNVSK
ncbi:putative glycosyltransferase [Aliivibrio fischeri MJ11]|uniref:Glycosyltransferase n=1 Tax=Aliivibrio fischeri (strain MJ11) TaxID=388396 RepID=B5FFV2_ALIFM|nr:galactosyltransferase-related protein [Aliivibrio fischeri]ACH65035.1 putative glycosyltransferase [Aliivibrio fischeri MJ11]